ncbi:MAG: M23 family metallopeptidase [Bacilli bacterium]|nr:M23 family metallopeptidase [Bacilli bacterium]
MKEKNPLKDKLKKARKIKLAMAAGGILPILFNILIVLVVSFIVMFPIMYIGERIEGFFSGVGDFVVTTSEKLINLTSGNGWLTNEKVYYDKLKEQYEKFNSFPTAEGEFDVAIIAATTHYSKMIGTYIFTKEECEGDPECSSDDYTPNDPPPIDKNQTRSFYKVAEDNLGSAFTFWPGQKKLVGHLVSTKFNARCVHVPIGWNILQPSSWDAYAGSVGDLLGSIVNEVIYTLDGTLDDLIASINPVKFATAIWAYASEGEASFIETQLKNAGYELYFDNIIETIDHIKKESNLDIDCNEMEEPAPEGFKWAKVPMMVKYIDYDRYKEYLKNVYLPLRFQSHLLKIDPTVDPNEWYNMKFYDGLTKPQQQAIDNMVNEIFAMRDSYLYLMKDIRDSVLKVSGMTSLPVMIGSGEDWMKYTSRGYQLGTASCYVNGKYTGRDNCNHLAIDFSWAGCENTPVIAIANGVVTVAIGNKPGPSGYGNYIIIGHDINNDDKYEYYSLYAHLNRVDVEVGDSVVAGQQIGLLGNTGNSSGPHLHFEIRDKNNNKIDPTPILNGIVSGTGNVLEGAITCGMFDNVELQAMNNALKSRVETAGMSTRSGVVAAARYLVNDLGVKIPYWWGGKYTQVGLNSEWGCKKPIIAGGSVRQAAGELWPLGLDCSGYVSWAIRNGGYKASTILEGTSNQYRFTDDKKPWRDPETMDSVKIGDLAWRYGHIGIILGIDKANCIYSVAEAVTAGLVVNRYDCTGSTFSNIILMDDYYNNDANKEVVE